MKNLIAIYGRLSKDEKGERYSSLEVQRDYVRQYIQDQHLGDTVDCFLDDDVTGVLFQREELDRLLAAIDQGKINIIVVKDLSRLGRSNAKTLTLLEYLEEKQIRVIAIDDNWDSFRNDDDIIGIKTWYNERYVKDISKKIRSNIHQKLKTGQYLGTPPYGYRKEYLTIHGKLKPINQLLVDEKLRVVISEIFSLYLQGAGYQTIAISMQASGYPNPSQYKNYARPQSCNWTKEQIKRIITNRVYCGDTVQGISERISFKSKKTRRKPVEAWYISENTHEAIISREIWLQANALRQQRAGGKVSWTKQQRHLFSGLLVCGACGRTMCARKKPNRPLGYACSAYATYGKQAQGCESHYLREETLAQLLWTNFISTLGEPAVLAGYQAYLNQPAPVLDYTGKIQALRNEIRQYSQHLELVYEDRLNHVVSADLYLEKSQQIEAKLSSLRSQVDALERQAQLSRKQAQLLQTERLRQLGPVNLAGHSILGTSDRTPPSVDANQAILALLARLWQDGQLTRQVLAQCLHKIYVYLPGDIQQACLEQVRAQLNTSLETVRRIQAEGGIFIVYKHF